MPKGKNVLTTGEVAKICNVAPRTVSKWFDSGQLKGYRIPGSKDRRIPVCELQRFMKMHNMPTSALQADRIRVMIVDGPQSRAVELAERLTEKTAYEIQSVASNFETGALAYRFSPHVILVNLLAEDIDIRSICQSIKADEELAAIRIIAIASQLSQSECSALLAKGFDDFILDPSDLAEVIRKIEKATDIIY